MLRNTIATSLLVSSALAYPTENKQNATTLDWAPCDLDFPDSIQGIIDARNETLDCATLSVPLDYTNSTGGRTIDLQLIRAKATQEPFMGSVLTNPGGPGGSGVEQVASDGPLYRDSLGGHHDVIGFDPRGTGRTIPFICIPSNATNSMTKRGEYNFTLPQHDMYASLVEKGWHDGGVYAEDCANTPGMADIGPYINTPFVARDMLEIIDALGEEKLQYWGISYGTVLGQTFAGMFPDRVGRVLLDSTVLLSDYTSGLWITQTRDTERTLVNFFSECINAGVELCPIANLTGPDTTADDLHKAYAKVFQELIDDPIYLPEDYVPAPWYQPGNITAYALLKYITLGTLYSPLQYGILSHIIHLALKRDWAGALTLLSFQLNQTTPEIPWNLGLDAFHGITCGDGLFRADKVEDMFSWTQAQAAAGTFADGFGPQIWPCAQWKFDAKERYTGPVTAINTSHPVLFVQGAFDPITPLSGAYEASAHFPGSRIVVQNGAGHAVLGHPSKCTIDAIARYFVNGSMPEVGTVCQTDQTGFEYYEDIFGLANSTLGKRELESLRRPWH
ncbi:alpha/beta-hydrolase [Didymella exigua CBS 183.55]|uniref:Alpha/beta-hydrolase n=1 Tax=Didymella exigua CBS 183.55 TaxID=1150837 RepID=A0A6A5R588_9PLEO|nr:alpha/beta-hydrolase [Didymella exigua CBS 183.55]KAF1923265.1 alpha/beta-hydrolase [Didymella exigua CBS 183.55]